MSENSRKRKNHLQEEDEDRNEKSSPPNHAQDASAIKRKHQPANRQRRKKLNRTGLPVDQGTFPSRLHKYRRVSGSALQAAAKQTHNKILRGELQKTRRVAERAARQAARNELLLHDEVGVLEVENAMERTYKVKQSEIVQAVDIQSANKVISLPLTEFGPYRARFSRNGQHVILGGRKGHVGVIEWKRAKKVVELHLDETVRDMQFLQDHTMFAVAQRKYVYMYDHQGTELHCMRRHIRPSCLQYLPYHWLLASAGHAGFLKYQDVSTGQLVCEHRTKLGPCDVMTQNPWNAIIHLGHANGTATLWSPNSTKPLVSVFCHKGPLRALSVDVQGRYMVSSGEDGQLKIWDLRTYKLLQSYFTQSPASALDISHRGLLSVGFGPHVQIWKNPFRSKQNSPYMSHEIPGQHIRSVNFCPFEDILGIGHSQGFDTILVPGSGEPNYDYFENNPYATTKQRREATIHALMEKIQPDMIVLDPTIIGKVDTRPKQEKEEDVRKAKKIIERKREANKARGKSSVLRRLRRKQRNIVDEKRRKIQERKLALKEAERKKLMEEAAASSNQPLPTPSALDRFKTKPKFS